MDMVLKRKIYKRAPFHKVKKESNGDGVIIESLININQFVAINEKDIIFLLLEIIKIFIIQIIRVNCIQIYLKIYKKRI